MEDRGIHWIQQEAAAAARGSRRRKMIKKKQKEQKLQDGEEGASFKRSVLVLFSSVLSSKKSKTETENPKRGN